MKEAWPQRLGWTEESWIKGQKANETFNRAEFICVSVSVTDEKGNNELYWSVHPKGYKSLDEWFRIDRKLSRLKEEYPDLVKALEEYTHKQGLTIFVS